MNLTFSFRWIIILFKLHPCLSCCKVEFETLYNCLFQELLGALQNHILDFTQRLHTVEIERRNLMCEIDKLKDENELGPQREEVEQLQDELNNLKDKVY